MKKRIFIPLFLFLFLFTVSFAACAPQKLETKELIIERAGAEPLKITAELAKTDEERSKGLMFRKKLPDGEGMLFIFDRDQQLSFWMKNTSIPLSIAYISSEGIIIDIKDMKPHDENPVLSSRMVRYALEVPQGWFTRAGIKQGDKVTGITSN